MRINTFTRWALLVPFGLLAVGCGEEPNSVLEPGDPSMAVGSNPGWDLNNPLMNPTGLDVNGAIWQWPVSFGVGTGQLNPFLSVQKNGVEEAFNSLINVPTLDGKRYTNYTHDLPLNHVPTIMENGTSYRELILDANEANSGGAALFAIQIFDLWLCDDPGAPNYDAISDFESNGDCALVYGLGGETAYATDEVTSGSGLDLDYRILIEEDDFTLAAIAAAGGVSEAATLLENCFYQGVDSPPCGAYLVLHVRFGGEAGWLTGSTFEELSTIKRPVPARLQLKKIIINDDGGTAEVGDFGIVTSAGSPTWSCNTVGDTTTCTSQAFALGAGSQTFSESDVTGYTEGSWSCTRTLPEPDGPNAAGSYDAGSLDLAEGEYWICEITNDDDPAHLTLKKIIVSDDGGSAVVGDFGIATSAGSPVWGCNTVGDTTTCTSQTFEVPAGESTFSEGDVSGYAEGTWSCSPVAETSSAYNNGAVTLANGESTTCEITNDDDPGHIILIKRVDNLYGGAATASDFGIQLNGGGVTFGAGSTVGTVTSYSTGPIAVSAGTQNFSEIDFAGYSEGTWSCSPVAATGSAYNAGSVDVANGQTVTCEITNTEEAPPAEETAWAANGLGAAFIGQLPYPGSNWATYVQYDGVAKTVTLFAGQTHDAGTVTFGAPAGGMVHVTINLSGWHFLVDGMVDVHAQDYANVGELETNPAPGQFEYSFSATSAATIEFDLPVNNYYGVHALVSEN